MLSRRSHPFEAVEQRITRQQAFAKKFEKIADNVMCSAGVTCVLGFVNYESPEGRFVGNGSAVVALLAIGARVGASLRRDHLEHYWNDYPELCWEEITQRNEMRDLAQLTLPSEDFPQPEQESN